MTEAMREKMSARRVLAILVGLLATVMALQGLASVKPGGFEALAQTSPSPTPGSPIIKLINPDSSQSRELSAKNDGTDTNYHLVAWVSAVPANAIVEFKFQADAAGSREQTIFCQDTASTTARFVSPDTFECKWNLADAPEANTAVETGGNTPTNGTVRAILYSGTTEQSRDEEKVAINNQDRPTPSPPQDTRIENQGDTVEIVYPANGGPVGFHTPAGSGARAVGVIDVTTSADTTDVLVYYSKSAPGSEPAFISCGNSTAETRANAQDGVRCTLAAGDRSAQVTAVAAVARDVAEDPIGSQQATANIDSGDAHRAFGYEQDPTSVLIDPQTHRVDANTSGFFACSQIIKATVLDQGSPQRKIAGANVDVHAAGPTDNLSFDDDEATSNNTSRSQAPDQGGHTTETSKNCEATTPSATNNDGNSTQGEHEQAGDGDRKHIESRDGTNDLGIFTFQLFSPNTGVTQFTAFADEDGNDLFCAAEAAGNGSVGWGTDPGSPTGVAAEQTSCPKPTPGATGSPAASPTATSSARPTASTSTSSGPTTDRTVTMAVDRARVVAGRQVTFSGQILSGDQSCTDNEFVQIRRRVLGTTTFSNLLTTATDSQGRFTFNQQATKSADYVAVATAHDNCREASSGEVTVLVKVKLQILASDTTPNRGDRFRIKSSVAPEHDGTKLILQRKKGSRWVKVATDTLNRRSRATFVVTANFRSRTFRTFWRSQDAEHESNKSRGITIKT